MALLLVVDDESLIRMSAADMAEELGFEVIEAKSADEAVRILENRSDISIVFSDVQMPGTMDGLRLVKLVRERWPLIELVLTSGKPLSQDEALPERCTFLPKPYSRKGLTEALHKAL
jgi:CheY-like chemotaxis protein